MEGGEGRRGLTGRRLVVADRPSVCGTAGVEEVPDAMPRPWVRLLALIVAAGVFAAIIERLRRPDVVWRGGAEGGDPAGVREPRVPRPPAGTGAAGAPLPPPA